MRLVWVGVVVGLALAQGPPGVFYTDVPAHGIDVIQARPTEHSVTLSLMAEKDATGTFEYETGVARKLELKAGVPFEMEVTGLAANRAYRYSVAVGGATVNGAFRTTRAAGTPFTFAVQADSHLDGNTDGRVYAKNLSRMVADQADFLVDLGDTFMTDKYPDYQDSAKQYVAQRYYFGLVGLTMPVFLTLGNHDGEVGWRTRGGDRTAWASAMRKKYFPTSGTGKNNYYAWTWGDALFVVLDPFTETREKPRTDEDGWNWTLGRTQYDWLKTTLEGSHAPFRFVFIHHLVGGKGKEARGGVEASKVFEWGGANLDGTRGFEQQRPGWAMPIHDLLVANHVAVVFHGHDHMYVKQERDGMVYQEVPQPSTARGDATRSAAEYGYLSGKLLGGSGYMRASVGKEQAVVEFVKNGEVADRYSIEKGAGR